jgi:hypothetical protein
VEAEVRGWEWMSALKGEEEKEAVVVVVVVVVIVVVGYPGYKKNSSCLDVTTNAAILITLTSGAATHRLVGSLDRKLSRNKRDQQHVRPSLPFLPSFRAR